VHERGLWLRLGCKPALSVTHSAAAAAVCGLWRYRSSMQIYCFCYHSETDSACLQPQAIRGADSGQYLWTQRKEVTDSTELVFCFREMSVNRVAA